MKKNQSKLRYLGIIIAIVVILALVVFRYWKNSTPRVTTSYRVNEVATMNQGAKGAKTLQGRRATSFGKNTRVAVERYYLLDQNDKQRTEARVSTGGNTYYVAAKDLNMVLDNRVNHYIAQLGYPHAKITKAIDRRFFHRRYSTANGLPRGVVVHDTGTEYSTLRGEVAYMEQNYRNDLIFVHSFVDANQILNIANTRYMAEGAGPKANPYYVQFETTHEYTTDSFAREIANAAYYTAYILKKYNLPVTKGAKNGSGTVWTHNMVSTYLGGSDHEDPTAYWARSGRRLFGQSYNINAFVELVQAYYNRI